MWFKMNETPLAWVDSAPRKFVNRITIDASPDEVFAVWADIDQWPKWFADIQRGEWTTDGERGVGSRRTVYLDDLNVKELIVAWEPGERFAFAIYEATLPLAHNIVEDYRLTPTPDGKSELVWTVGYDLRWFMKPLSFVVAKQFGGMFEKAIVDMKDYIENR